MRTGEVKECIFLSYEESFSKNAGLERIELPLAVLETAVLPLNDRPNDSGIIP